jgi:hypothetical protein
VAGAELSVVKKVLSTPRYFWMAILKPGCLLILQRSAMAGHKQI